MCIWTFEYLYTLTIAISKLEKVFCARPMETHISHCVNYHDLCSALDKLNAVQDGSALFFVVSCILCILASTLSLDNTLTLLVQKG